jgi:hypothetical protein
LEELDELFAAPNPVKASLKSHKLMVTAEKEVVGVEDA